MTGHLETLVDRIQKNKPSKLNPNEMFVLIIPTLRWPGQAVDPELCPKEGCKPGQARPDPKELLPLAGPHHDHCGCQHHGSHPAEPTACTRRGGGHDSHSGTSEEWGYTQAEHLDCVESKRVENGLHSESLHCQHVQHHCDQPCPHHHAGEDSKD